MNLDARSSSGLHASKRSVTKSTQISRNLSHSKSSTPFGQRELITNRGRAPRSPSNSKSIPYFERVQ